MSQVARFTFTVQPCIFFPLEDAISLTIDASARQTAGSEEEFIAVVMVMVRPLTWQLACGILDVTALHVALAKSEPIKLLAWTGPLIRSINAISFMWIYLVGLVSGDIAADGVNSTD